MPISTCLHADLRRIFVLTQFNSMSLNRHIAQSYHMDAFSRGFVDILAAEQTPDNPLGFRARRRRTGRRHAISSATTPTTTGFSPAITSTDGLLPPARRPRQSDADITVARSR